ncbi:hypothetical protein [Croceicoccus naphthovorans]|uniref:Uncharacterized protein n=1 Tax=Croceicoccus naphthovorans TaxID=1348774 RepID=A0A0G3XG94_9SPHN|nr:hypothetical protein [Croceicoccus naphthovorans]AKM09629.1 hypothetical protein AB433_05960 [Croceicoccus naphthovorans]MBB3989593.1 hypothetical protein [Croceicoccus naphthovorans]
MNLILPFSAVWLACAAACAAKVPAENTREAAISGYIKTVEYWDQDGDNKLSRSEMANMVDEAFQRPLNDTSTVETVVDLQTQRQAILGFYTSQDTNHDGYLTLEELLAGPLATFDCMDVDGDRRLSVDETSAGMDRCPSIDLDDFASNH